MCKFRMIQNADVVKHINVIIKTFDASIYAIVIANNRKKNMKVVELLKPCCGEWTEEH